MAETTDNLAQQLLADMQRLMTEDNGISEKQKDHILMSTIAYLVRTQETIKADVAEMKKITHEQVALVPEIVWAIMRKPRHFLVILALCIALLSAIYIKESRDFLIGLLLHMAGLE